MNKIQLRSRRQKPFWEHTMTWKLSANSIRGRLKEKHFQLHSHSFHEIGFVKRGDCDWLFLEKRIRLTRGDLIFIPKGVLHTEQAAEASSTELAWVGFWFAGAENLEVPKRVQKSVATGDHYGDVLSLMEQINREHHLDQLGSERRVDLLIQSLVILLFRCASRNVEQPAPHKSLNARQIQVVRSAANYFRENFSNPLSISQVAGYHSMCAPYFSTLFRKYHGISPQVYLHRIRMEHVERYLAEGQLTLKEIAEYCGFVDAAHLCKRFKQENGKTPKQFREGILSQLKNK
ncbi:MAG: AraC family transcriptional regulator [Verrucomicrobiota bacterium]